MADLIRIRGGTGNVPNLSDREPGYDKNMKILYIGTPSGNVRLCGADDMREMTTILSGLSDTLAESESALNEIMAELSNIKLRLDALEALQIQ